ncbi:MAG: Hsp20/alpha crystallin family protein [Sphaerochaetaceae bacterium]|nr:Hsp20/alpha crystallin family protein [Sphaerochaetaceae bacterium]MDC7237530.1 Hsp20/alpha crystallin family protein [Sphaerochaetaceae bacterium]MDC7242633.1 Hsp20/alpha crystallin family protein [Sphaerochaetaceae bacterium]MDC7249051.1 Hsp20/alpha crystallin family protein [Sphaerochaetaceae bacterium]
MYNNFNSLFDDFFDAFNSVSVKIPPVDVYEMDDGYYLDVELPGYSNEDVNVKIENNTLTLSTTDEFNKSLEKVNEETNFLVRETKMKRSFKRAFSLPKDVDEEAISATFNNGVLNIKLPKSKKLAPKTIEIIAQ